MWPAVEQHLEHGPVSRIDVLDLASSYLSESKDVPERLYPVRDPFEGGVVGWRRRDVTAHHNLGEWGEGFALQLARTAECQRKGV
jgi:hypothetical protein